MDTHALREELGAAMVGAASPLAAADRLCLACVDLLEVDGASISFMNDGTTRGTFGSSGELSRTLDELQFTYGEGPCVDAVRDGAPVLADDLADPQELRWPVLRGELLERGVRAVFALPVTISAFHVGALDLYRNRSGVLSDRSLGGGLLAAELAALPLLDLMQSDIDWEAASQGAAAAGGGHWEQLASLERVEVYQATGMIMAAFEVGSVEALVRLRARAFALGQTASELAWSVVERRTLLGDDGWLPGGAAVSVSREAEVNQAFVALASRLVDGYDVVDLLGELTEQCASLLDIASAGLLLADPAGTLHVLAASSERTRLLEVFQLQRAQGPCRECYLSGRPVSVTDLDTVVDVWPDFVRTARALGFHSVHALPMRLHDRVLGALGLFGGTVGTLGAGDLALGQALADVASVALVQDMNARDSGAYNAQLQTALTSRVVLEQAKGVLAQLGSLSVDDAFGVLRRYARANDLMLSTVAQAVVAREIDLRSLLSVAGPTA